MLKRLKLSGGSTSGATSGGIAGAETQADAGSALLPLTVRSLSYGVDGQAIIDGLNLTIEADGPTVILGPNGAGKSVLLRLLHGLLPPTAGCITWGRLPSMAVAAKRQAMVFQKPVLLRRSVGANIDFVLRLKGRCTAAERDAWLDLAGLSQRCNQPARALSGGEQQRLALVRALALEPDVLLLDEPTASLDPASVLKIETIALNAVRNGTKVILVTHDLGQAKRLAAEVVFLHRGRIVEHRPAADFFNGPESAEARGYLDGRIVL